MVQHHTRIINKSISNRLFEIDFTDGSNIKTLRYQIVDSPIADAWWNIVQGALSDISCRISANQWIQGSPDEHIDKLWGRMKTLVDELNTDCYVQLPQLSMPAEFDPNVDHSELLNYLHLQFHKFADESTEYTPLSELNLIIHKIESILQNKKTACGFHLEWDYSLLVPRVIDIEDMEWYQHWNTDSQFGDMTLGYHTIGKNLWMCYQDNDIGLVKSGMMSPQRTISSEINLLFHTRSRQRQFNGHSSIKKNNFLLMCKWMENNNLTQYIDMSKPYNCAIGQPLLGKLVGPYTPTDISRILGLGRVGSVRLL